MTRIIGFGLVVLVVLACSDRASADEKADALLAKGVAVLGGEDALAKFKAATWKAQGQFHGAPDGQPLAFTGTWAWQAPDKFRIALTMTATGIQKVRVLDGDKGWVKRDDATAEEMPPEVAAEEQRQAAALTALTTLLPLKEMGVNRELGGELVVGGRTGLELKATRDGREMRVWFDKETGLPLKGAWTVKDAAGKDVLQEMLPSDYQEFNGVKKALKLQVLQDGKLLVEMQLSDFKAADKLDEKVFAKP
jgi:outer membrane lipoprotein-sorting protein